MSGRRMYGSFLRNECLQSQGFDAMMASGSSLGFHGSRSMVNFENFQGNASKRHFYDPLDFKEIDDGDLDECLQLPGKKRRLTSNQVQSLEKNFELENKLEPEKKMQLARDIGLHPRQVAIWFQNRRARWKTKQLEKDYEALNSSHNLLKADYEDLFKEKEKLEAEVLVLTEKLMVKEKRGSLELFEPNNMLQMVPISESDSNSQAKTSEAPVSICKQEALSSSDSAVSDSDSPRCADGIRSSLYELAESSNTLEADQSDRSYFDDDREVKMCSLLKLEDSPLNYEFPMEDQALWFWPY